MYRTDRPAAYRSAERHQASPQHVALRRRAQLLRTASACGLVRTVRAAISTPTSRTGCGMYGMGQLRAGHRASSQTSSPASATSGGRTAAAARGSRSMRARPGRAAGPDQFEIVGREVGGDGGERPPAILDCPRRSICSDGAQRSSLSRESRATCVDPSEHLLDSARRRWIASGWKVAAVIMAITIIGRPGPGPTSITQAKADSVGCRALRRDEVTGQSALGTGALGLIGNLIRPVLARGGWRLVRLHTASRLATRSSASPIGGRTSSSPASRSGRSARRSFRRADCRRSRSSTGATRIGRGRVLRRESPGMH